MFAKLLATVPVLELIKQPCPGCPAIAGISTSGKSARTPCGLARANSPGTRWNTVSKLAGPAELIDALHATVAGKRFSDPIVAECDDPLSGFTPIPGNGQYDVGRLTPRERAVADCLRRARSNKEIALDLTALWPADDGGVYIGWYGSGLAECAATKPAGGTGSSNGRAAQPSAVATGSAPPFPEPAKLPGFVDLNAMADVADAACGAHPADQPGWVVALDDDWTTQGDWLGRYGRYYAILCAIVSPRSYLWGAAWEPVKSKLKIGPNANPGDGLRYWIHWLYSSNPRVLEMPPTYLDSRIKRGLTTPELGRREAEVDDHGEAYPYWNKGPSVYCTLDVPKGVYYLSLYDYNKDGHGGLNRLRDYTISIRSHPVDKPIGDVSGFEQQPELAGGRIFEFWGGVWKRFLVEGPTQLTIEVNRNHMFNTILPAVMLDLTDEEPAPYFCSVAQWTARDEQERLGLTPAREIEKALRWDGLSQDGEDYQVVTRYLQRHPSLKVAVAAN